MKKTISKRAGKNLKFEGKDMLNNLFKLYIE